MTSVDVYGKSIPRQQKEEWAQSYKGKNLFKEPQGKYGYWKMSYREKSGTNVDIHTFSNVLAQ